MNSYNYGTLHSDHLKSQQANSSSICTCVLFMSALLIGSMGIMQIVQTDKESTIITIDGASPKLTGGALILGSVILTVAGCRVLQTHKNTITTNHHLITGRKEKTNPPKKSQIKNQIATPNTLNSHLLRYIDNKKEKEKENAILSSSV
jgi:hypothetical protein